MLANLFLAVATAVFDYAVDKLDPVDRAREWLKRDAVRLAFQKALACAYTAFARQYPELTASLFDQSFLAKEAAPELAKLLTRHEHPDPARLAGLWLASLSPLLSENFPTGEGPGVRAEVRAASDFLHWLESELKAQPVLQPLFDSRALESLPALEAKLDSLTDEIKRALDAALKTASQYEHAADQRGGLNINAQGEVTIGGDVIARDKIVTAVYNTYFTGGFASLKDLYKPPEGVFQRVRVHDFVGRDWLMQKVEAFVAQKKSGAFILVGEAGVGKTSFLAHLVQAWRCPHLFADDFPGDGNVPFALLSLGAQLVTRYRVEEYARRDALPEIAASPTFLDKLLRLAAGNLGAAEKIVIVCDGLDEAGIGSNGNVFGLPRDLPDGVYLILSSRPPAPVPARLNFKEFTPRVETLDPASPENRADVETYLRTVARRPPIAGQLRAQGYDEAAFVRTLAEMSGGVWMYLHLVAKDIEDGERKPLDLEKLPPGLNAYYAEYWERWRQDVEKWDEVYGPLLATLAAAQEPLPLPVLLAWAGVKEKPYAVKRLLEEKWQAFVRCDPGGRYAPYHASLRDFLTGDVERLPAPSAIAEDRRDRARDAHTRIVEDCRARCGGDWLKLATADGPPTGSGPGDYARRYLSAHLAGAGRFEELFALAAESNAWAEARYSKEESYAGYLTDLERAWTWAEEGAWNVGRQIRCALIKSSLHSLAGNVSPDLLYQAVQTGLWSGARALDHVRQMPKEHQRAEALGKIAPLLSEGLKAEALAAARGIGDDRARAGALSGLAAHLPDELKAEALAEALAVARGIQSKWARAEALSGLAAHLPDALKADALAEALAAARGIGDEGARARALSGLAAHLLDALKAEALAVARGIGDEGARARALSGLAAHLPDALKAEALAEALAAARGIGDEEVWAQALSRLAAHLPDALKAEALAVARGIQSKWARAIALSGLAAHLPDALKAEALTEALAAAKESEPRLSHDRSDLFSRIISTWKQIGYSGFGEPRQRWPGVLRALARRRREELLPDLGALAPLVAHFGGREAIVETFRAMRDVVRWWP